jgi:SAM-dependent methyltransferase
MAQAYSAAFARVYDLRWAGFATQVAPRLRAFYEQQPAREAPRALLDVGCGTGHLAYHFLEAGYEVAGLDLSPAMLAHARERCAAYVAGGQAVFFEADAASFQLPRQFGLVVSTFDALNHLPDMAALQGAFASVRRALAPGGLFVFDLNTALGLAQRWNSISIDDTEELFLLNRGIYQPDAGQAYTSITGFVRGDDGRYERFKELVYNTAFSLVEVETALRAAGWPAPYAAHLDDLHSSVSEPEALPRAFFVARLQ